MSSFQELKADPANSPEGKGKLNSTATGTEFCQHEHAWEHVLPESLQMRIENN